jgi:hypothetical protein
VLVEVTEVLHKAIQTLHAKAEVRSRHSMQQQQACKDGVRMMEHNQPVKH